jgi:hypothetical protein
MPNSQIVYEVEEENGAYIAETVNFVGGIISYGESPQQARVNALSSVLRHWAEAAQSGGIVPKLDAVFVPQVHDSKNGTEEEITYLLRSETMKRRLLEAKERTGGVSLEEARARLGI